MPPTKNPDDRAQVLAAANRLYQIPTATDADAKAIMVAANLLNNSVGISTLPEDADMMRTDDRAQVSEAAMSVNGTPLPKFIAQLRDDAARIRENIVARPNLDITDQAQFNDMAYTQAMFDMAATALDAAALTRAPGAGVSGEIDLTKLGEKIWRELELLDRPYSDRQSEQVGKIALRHVTALRLSPPDVSSDGTVQDLRDVWDWLKTLHRLHPTVTHMEINLARFAIEQALAALARKSPR